MNISSALAQFCVRYMPAGSQHPKVNLLRKFYHTKLAKLSGNREALYALFMAVDKHSKRVAQDHSRVHRHPRASAQSLPRASQDSHRSAP